MKGKYVGAALLLAAALAGAGMYWAQIYAFYEPVATDAENVQLTARATGIAEPVAHTAFEGIDASSSPLRYRACFNIKGPVAALKDTYVAYENPVPLEAPGWFTCYDADEIGGALERGAAQAFLGEFNVVYGIDRVVAVFPDGRARVWHQINRCGEEVFDGRPPPEGCPPAPERTK